MPDNFLFKKISTLLALGIITFLAAVVGAYAIWQSEKIKDLTRPLHYYTPLDPAASADF